MKRGKYVDLKCSFCGSIFKKKRSEFDKAVKSGNLNHYCNVNCFKKRRKLTAIKNIREYNNTSNKKCPNCGILIVSNIDNKRNKFCSQSCSAEYNNLNSKKIKKICSICGNDYIGCEKIKKYKSKCKRCRKLKKIICKICGKKKCNKSNKLCESPKSFVLLHLEKFNLNIEKVGSNEIFEEFSKIGDILRDDYYNKELDLKQIREKYKYKDHTNVMKIMDVFGIKRRCLSEAIFNGLKNGRIKISTKLKTKFKRGWHTSWEGKKFYYRSSYELKYCKELDDKKIKYSLEELRIPYFDSNKRKKRVAFPDFYLPDTNEIIEIKSCYTYNEQEMKDKFKAYRDLGYKCKLIVDFKEVVI